MNIISTRPEDYNHRYIIHSMEQWVRQDGFEFTENNMAYQPDDGLACIIVSQAPYPELFEDNDWFFLAMLEKIQEVKSGGRYKPDVAFIESIGAANVAYIQALGKRKGVFAEIEDFYEHYASEVGSGNLDYDTAREKLADYLHEQYKLMDLTGVNNERA